LQTYFDYVLISLIYPKIQNAKIEERIISKFGKESTKVLSVKYNNI